MLGRALGGVVVLADSLVAAVTVAIVIKRPIVVQGWLAHLILRLVVLRSVICCHGDLHPSLAFATF